MQITLLVYACIHVLQIMAIRAPMAITQRIHAWDSVQLQVMETRTLSIVFVLLSAQEDLSQIIALCFACRYVQLILLRLATKATGLVLNIVLMIYGLMLLLALAIPVAVLISDSAT